MRKNDQINLLTSRLEAVEKAARGSRWGRLRRAPLRYLGAMAYTYLLYPIHQRGYRTSTATFFGTPMEILLPAAMDIFLLGAKTHDSEIRLCRFLLKALEPGGTFIDVGAHYGFFTLLAAKLVGERGRVLALEASSKNFELLAANTRAMPNVEVFHLAASDSAGEVILYEYPPWLSEANTTLPPVVTSQASPTLVPAVRLDQFFGQEKITPSVIKIDVEGAEALVAKGMADWLATASNPLIAMEYLPAGSRGLTPHQEALQYFGEFGLQAFLIGPQGNLTHCPDVEDYIAMQKLDSENIVLKRTS